MARPLSGSGPCRVYLSPPPRCAGVLLFLAGGEHWLAMSNPNGQGHGDIQFVVGRSAMELAGLQGLTHSRTSNSGAGEMQIPTTFCDGQGYHALVLSWWRDSANISFVFRRHAVSLSPPLEPRMLSRTEDLVGFVGLSCCSPYPLPTLG